MTILLLEDDELLGECARLGLVQRGFLVVWVADIRSARAALQENTCECVLLDLGLPDGDGMDFLRQLRKSGNDIPVIIITARYALEERIRGLEYGADDYVAKPYSLDELAARIRAVVRRREGRASNLLDLGGIQLDPTKGTASRDGEPVELSAIEFRLLRYFMEHAGKIQSREKLLQAICGDDTELVTSNLLDVHIHHLRKKIGSERIKTVRGLGYMFMKDD
ncbi:response regulator [Thiolapillus sp.]|uniref:response regulator n=4 Tax=Thiolapillus sp. TaxID=2017437 RepID=UPI0025EEAF09|nr:response regulator [Thiolapillus sp.]